MIQGPVLFYDAECSICRRFVAFVVAADRTGVLRIAPLQGTHAQGIRRFHPEFALMDSAVFLPREGIPLRRSDAILATLDILSGPWPAVARLGRLVPRPIRDLCYRAFVRHRDLFGWLGLPELDPRCQVRQLPEPPPDEATDAAT